MKKKGFLIILILAVVFMGACAQRFADAERWIPERAEIKESLGNGWFYIELDGRSFLFGQRMRWGKGYMAITEISK